MRARLVALVALAVVLSPPSTRLTHAEDPKPARSVFVVPSPLAGELSPAEREKAVLLEHGLLSSGAEAPEGASARPVPIPSTSAVAGSERSDCIYQSLTSGLVQIVTPSNASLTNVFYYDQPTNYWSAVGVRSASGEDWDIELYAARGGYWSPCFDTLIAYSNRYTGVDFVVGDYNHIGANSDYTYCNRFSGTQNGLLEWDDGPDALAINGPPVVRSTGSSDILETWDVVLEAGKNYTFLLNVVGSADLKVLLFRNPGSGAHYTNRNGALFEQAAGGIVSYWTSQTDWYGLVVVNDNGGSGTYTLQAGTCLAASALTSGVSVATPAAHGHYSCNQSFYYWSAAGVRADDPSANWDIALYGSPTGGSWPACFSTLLGYSTESPGRVDFVALDFNGGHNPLGTFHAHSYRTVGSGDARTEWDDGNDLLLPGSWVGRSTDASDVLETWDIGLEANVDYNLEVSPTGADVKAVVLRPIPYGYWASRSDGLVDTGGPCGHFTTEYSAYHAVVAVNENGATGSYWLRIVEQMTADPPSVVSDTGDARGVAFADYDNDGDPDLYVANYCPDENKLFRNNGGGSFSDVTTPALAHASGCDVDPVWGDYDNDGDLDLYLVNNGGANVLFRNNGAGSFTDVSAPPINDAGMGQSASWADYDRDGRLDLFLANGGAGDKLFRNAGGGVFTDVTPPVFGGGTTIQGIWGDYDGDGDPDLYLVQSWSGKLLRNDDGVFVDVTSGPLDPGSWVSSGAWVDYDNDLDPDLWISGYYRNFLLRNDGGVFADATTPELRDSTWSRVSVWGDYDNNGLVDAYLPSWGGPNKLFRNLGDGSFVQVLSAGLAGSDITWGISLADVDGDGDLDQYLGKSEYGPSLANQLVRNGLCSGRTWLDVKLAGVCSNRFGVGARITVWAATYPQMREVVGQSGDCSYVTHFGFFDAAYVDEIEVRWPSGAVQYLYSVPTNQTLTIVEDVSGLVGVAGVDAVPRSLALHPNVPNPFNPSTTVRYDLPLPLPVRLAVYDVAGRLVRALVDDASQAAGRHEAVWDGRDETGAEVGTGVYFCRLRAGNEARVEKMTLVR